MLILASESLRRRQLLELAGLEFRCEPSHVDESVPEGLAAEDVPEYLAQKKAEDIWKAHPDDVVLGADTLVVFEGEILGKPHSDEEAYEMLRSLSGEVHHVYTGVAIHSREKTVSFTSVTKVEFYDLTDEEIRAYIATGEPRDKAGAYAIQGKGSLFIKRIHGDYYTVMGLPLAEVVRHLPESVKKSGGQA
ncbi:MAG: Maf family protein [Lachnospiraceae bacterium]|nr:Maf family protein [Lachnospiraceae bacterium]